MRNVVPMQNEWTDFWVKWTSNSAVHFLRLLKIVNPQLTFGKGLPWPLKNVKIEEFQGALPPGPHQVLPEHVHTSCVPRECTVGCLPHVLFSGIAMLAGCYTLHQKDQQRLVFLNSCTQRHLEALKKMNLQWMDTQVMCEKQPKIKSREF